MRDLVTLSTTSTATESEVELKYKTTTERAKRELDHANWAADQRHRQQIDVAQQTHDLAVNEAGSKFNSERNAILAKDKAIRARIADEYKTIETAAMKEYDQAAWLAQSVFDAMQIGCAAEIKKAAEELETRQAVLTDKEHELTQLPGLLRLPLFAGGGGIDDPSPRRRRFILYGTRRGSRAATGGVS